MGAEETSEYKLALQRVCPACQAQPGDRCTWPTSTRRREVKVLHLARLEPVASEEFIDPLYDPRFPERPQTPDFWRLSEVVIAHDEDRRDMSTILNEAVDEASLNYMVDQRVARTVQLIVHGGGDIVRGLKIAYLDAFMLGVDFQKRGGHRPNETGNTGEKEGSS